MNDTAKRWIAKSVADGWDVVTTPLARSEGLTDLFSDEVSEHRKLVGEIVIDSDDLFLQIRRRVVAADER